MVVYFPEDNIFQYLLAFVILAARLDYIRKIALNVETLTRDMCLKRNVSNIATDELNS
jgi:hypothetical protein